GPRQASRRRRPLAAAPPLPAAPLPAAPSPAAPSPFAPSKAATGWRPTRRWLPPNRRARRRRSFYPLRPSALQPHVAPEHAEVVRHGERGQRLRQRILGHRQPELAKRGHQVTAHGEPGARRTLEDRPSPLARRRQRRHARADRLQRLALLARQRLA